MATVTPGTLATKRFLGERAVARTPLEIAETCPKIPVLAPTWKTCGKAGCRCTRGEPHGPYWSLRWREAGVHRRRYVRPADLAVVRAAVARRRAERVKLRDDLAEALALLREMRARCREGEGPLAPQEDWR